MTAYKVIRVFRDKWNIPEYVSAWAFQPTVRVVYQQHRWTEPDPDKLAKGWGIFAFHNMADALTFANTITYRNFNPVDFEDMEANHQIPCITQVWQAEHEPCDLMDLPAAIYNRHDLPKLFRGEETSNIYWKAPPPQGTIMLRRLVLRKPILQITGEPRQSEGGYYYLQYRSLV